MEIGRIGQHRYAGNIHEEFLPELQGGRGIKVYKEMSANDDVIGAILYAIKMLVRQVDWHIEPQGTTVKDKKAAEFLETCLHDMSDTWVDIISEILSFLPYGWSYHEICYKRRTAKTSKYADGLIGWEKLPIRSQDSLYEWNFDSRDNLLGMTQMPSPDFELFFIPIEKALLFRTEQTKGNPEGKSILRNAYRSWYFKKHIQEIEGIGIERDLAGFPVLYTPEDLDIWAEENENVLIMLESMVKNIRRDETEGLVLPHGFELQLLASNGKRQFDTNEIINRYDNRMAMTVLADFIFLGHESTGSWALSSDKTELFAMACGTYLNIICEAFNNKAIPELIRLNQTHFKGITDTPKLVHGDIEDEDMTKVAAYLKDMVGIGLVEPDEELEAYARRAGHLPAKKA